MTHVRRTLQGAAGVLAAMPGLATLLGGLGTPPKRQDIYGGLLLAAGVLAILLFSRPRGPLRAPTPRTASLPVALLALSVCASVLYFTLLQSTVVDYVEHFAGKNPTTMKVVFPLYPTEKLSKMIEKARGKEEAMARYGVSSVQREISKARVGMALTDAILLTLLLLAQVALVVALLFAAALAAPVHAVKKFAEEAPDLGTTPQASSAAAEPNQASVRSA